jgi:hypothetical protein
MSGAVPLLPQYAFMVWCSVKAQGQLYLYRREIGCEGRVKAKFVSVSNRIPCHEDVWENGTSPLDEGEQ